MRTKLRVMLVDENAQRMATLEHALLDEGHVITARLATAADLNAAAELHEPDVIFIDVDAPGRDTLDAVGQLNRERPRPTILFAARSDAETTRRAVQVGVSAYVVDGLHPARLPPLLEVALARFDLHQALRKELNQARIRLADHRDIEKAKGLIMKRRGLDEPAAYGVLRRMAMDREQRIGDGARTLLTAADVL